MKTMSVDTAEYFERGIRRRHTFVTIVSDTFNIGVQAREAEVTMRISEKEAYELTKELLCSLSDEQQKNLSQWMKENSF